MHRAHHHVQLPQQLTPGSLSSPKNQPNPTQPNPLLLIHSILSSSPRLFSWYRSALHHPHRHTTSKSDTMTRNHPTLRKTQSSASMHLPYQRFSWHPDMTHREQRAWPNLFPEPFDHETLYRDSPFLAPVPEAKPPAVPPKVPQTPIPELHQPPTKLEPSMKTSEETKTVKPEEYTQPFCDFLTQNPTVFHAVDAVAKDLEAAGFKKLSERDIWKLNKGGLYYVERNGSSLIAFAVGPDYEPGNGAAILAGHIDALCARLKPVPQLRTKSGYVQLGVAPYAGALNSTWWDRDLGVGGRVLVKEDSGKIVSKLVKLDWPSKLTPHVPKCRVTRNDDLKLSSDDSYHCREELNTSC
ncbi:aminopeptidase I zinc metalloprotease-domain-containing protein [Phyllosticta citrichinensis]